MARCARLLVAVGAFAALPEASSVALDRPTSRKVPQLVVEHGCNAKDPPYRKPGTAKRELRLEELCQVGPSRLSILDDFISSFNERYSQRIMDAFSGAGDASAYLTVGEWRVNGMLRNFLIHLEGTARKQRRHMFVGNIALDASNQHICEVFRKTQKPGSALQVACIDFTGWLPAGLFVDPSTARLDKNGNPKYPGEGNAGFGSCPFQYIVWTKPVLLWAAVHGNSGKSVLLIDTDVVVYKDVFQWADKNMPKSKTDPQPRFITGTDGSASSNTSRINTGTIMTDSTDLIEQWIKQENCWINENYVDQDSLTEVFWSTVLPRSPQNRPLLRQFPKDVIGQCGQMGAVATHYTCVGGKARRMKKKGDWDSAADTPDI